MSEHLTGLPENQHFQPENDQAAPFEYQILDDPERRIQYLNLTDELVRKMVSSGTDVAVYLDKSARPVAWMVHELWDQLAPRNEDGTIPKEPTIKFLNIDREQWGAVIGRSEAEGDSMDINRVPADRISELRQIFQPLPGAPDRDDSSMAGKKIMIIDEVSVSGDTLTMSRGIMNRAFPDAAAIEGTYWMSGKVKQDPRSGVRLNTDLPVWYSDRESTGRLVADRDTTKSLSSNSQIQRIGRFWLSTTFRERDNKGVQLKMEAKQLAKDLREHKILYKPAVGWGRTEAVGERILRLNGITLDDYRELRQSSPTDEAMQQKYFDLLEQQSRRPSAE